MTDTSEEPSGPRGTLRARIMTEFRRAPNGLDPDDVYAHVVRLQTRIDFLEGQLREASNAALLDAMLQQAAKIRCQALEAAERSWMDIIQAASEEAAWRREEAMRDARRLLDDACAEIRGIHDRLQAPTRVDAPIAHERFPGPDLVTPAATSNLLERPRPSGVNGRSTGMHQDSLADVPRTEVREVEPPFHLPDWIQE